MVKVRAYKVSDFARRFGQQEEIPQVETPPVAEAAPSSFDVHMIGGLVEDFGVVTAAIKNFPYRNALSLAGFLAVLYIAFKVGKDFGIIQSNIKGKGK